MHGRLEQWSDDGSVRRRRALIMLSLVAGAALVSVARTRLQDCAEQDPLRRAALSASRLHRGRRRKVALLLTMAVESGSAKRGGAAHRLLGYNAALRAWMEKTDLSLYVVESTGRPLDDLHQANEWSWCGMCTERRPAEARCSGRGGGSESVAHGVQYPGRIFYHQVTLALNSVPHLPQDPSRRSGLEARSIALAARHFRKEWEAEGVTHVLKVTGHYFLPALQKWIRRFEVTRQSQCSHGIRAGQRGGPITSRLPSVRSASFTVPI